MANAMEEISRMDTHDRIEAHEAEARAAHDGHAVLKELARVQTGTGPEMSICNAIRLTETRTIWTVVALSFTYFCGLNALNLPSAQINFMVAELGDAADASWISTALSTGIAVVTPTISGLTDLLGRKYAILAGCLLGVIGSVVAGSAHETTTIVAGQAINGASIALVFISSASVAEIVPAFTRPFWGAVVHAGSSLFSILDPIYAGALVKSGVGGWRWIFYINAFIYGLGIFILFFIYKTTSRTEALGIPKRQIARQFDYLGIVLLAAGIVLLLCGLSWGGNALYGWKSSYAIAPTVVGAVCLAVLLPLWELYGTRTPFLVLSLFRDRTYNMLLVLAFVSGMANLCSTAYLPQIIQAFWQSDPILINIYRIPYLTGNISGAFFSGVLFQATGKYKWAYVAYSACLLVGQGLFAVLQPHTTVAAPLILSVVTGVGVGATTQLGFTVAQFCVPQDKLGLGIGVLNTIRSVGGAIGVAIFNTVLGTKNTENLVPAIKHAALDAGAKVSQLPAIIAASAKPATLVTAAGGNMKVVEAVVNAIKQTHMNSYRIVFLAIIPFCVVGIVCCLFLKEVTAYLNNETVFGIDHHNKYDTDVQDSKAVEGNEITVEHYEMRPKS